MIGLNYKMDKQIIIQKLQHIKSINEPKKFEILITISIPKSATHDEDVKNVVNCCENNDDLRCFFKLGSYGIGIAEYFGIDGYVYHVYESDGIMIHINGMDDHDFVQHPTFIEIHKKYMPERYVVREKSDKENMLDKISGEQNSETSN